MNEFARIQKLPKTHLQCKEECLAMEALFDGGFADVHVRCCLELAKYRHFGSDISISNDRIAKAIQGATDFNTDEFGWFRKIREALPFMLLFGSEREIEQFVKNWPVDADPNMTTPLEYQMPMLYLLVCNELRSDRQPSEHVEEKIAKSRKKNPIQFLKVFQAAVRGTQSEYEAALIAGLKHYQGLPESYLDATIAMYICRELTCINLMAERLGKKCPDLPAELGACLMTKASVGCKP